MDNKIKNIFSSFVGKRIAIYGTGNNSKVILNYICNLNVIGIISDDSIGGFFGGYTILSMEEAIDKSDIILIAAVPTSTNEIYKRIKESVPENIQIYDMRGHNLNTRKIIEVYLNEIEKNENDKKFSDYFKKQNMYTEHKFLIESYKSIAMLIAPITVNYLNYIFEMSKYYDYLLFASRDGYLLYKLYSELVKREKGYKAKGIYFYTSRTAIKAAMRNNTECKNYVNYIKSLNLKGKGAVVDIVTQGTICFGLRKLLNLDVDLIAVGTTAVPNKYVTADVVNSMLGNINEEFNGIPFSFNDFSELHLFLEMLYASVEGQFDGFTNDGHHIFEKNEYNEKLLVGVQNELEKIVKNMIENNVDCTYEYSTYLLQMFYRNNAFYSEEIKNAFTFNDPYDDRLHNCNLIDKLGW